MGTYDRAISVFSPDGRIFQVEYAQLASERGSPVVFLADGEKIAVAIEKRSESKLKVLDDLDKFKEVETGIYLTFAGIWPDTLALVDEAIFIARNYSYAAGEKIDIRKLSLLLSDFIQRFTIKGGWRPFGAKIVLFGFDPSPVVTLLEPDGNYAMYRGGAIGQKAERATEELEANASAGLSPLTAVAKTLYTVAQKDPSKMTLIEITPEVARVLSSEEKTRLVAELAGSAQQQ